MPVSFREIEPLLLKVEKPGRYLGGEFNQVVKEGPEVRVRVCLAFPDVYDLGMSYHGYNLLYERVNRHEYWAAERAFTPWPDFDALLRERGIPLFSMETRRALSEFDVVGFTLQHEVNYTNILSMLDLGGIPVESKDRREPFPLIIGGGEGAFSPEPMAQFMDAFVIGDGEEAIEDVCAIVERAKSGGWNREQLLVELAKTPGVYVPEFYDVAYHEDGRVKSVTPNREGVPTSVKKRHFDITRDKGSTKPVVPLLRTVHDRFSVEIRRGCVNGCRFCQAGMITRPVRERSVDQIYEIAEEAIANTGYDEISLLSLSSADYTAIGTLVRRMSRNFGPRRVSVSLPSLRINAFDVDIADEIRGVRKSGFTFAPEAGTDRLRRVINKEVDQTEFLNIIEQVFSRGWQTVKLYFMVGLPTETDEDLDGIVQLTREAAQIGRKHHGRKAIVNVTLSPFVPKSNTPFQWEPQPEEAELNRRYNYVKSKLRGGNVDVKTNDTRSAFIEATLARGDRRMGAALKRAWEMGCRFDGWDEYFSYGKWLDAFQQVGMDPTFYANRQREEDEVFPFDHIDSSLGKRFLWADQRRAWRMRVMEPCEVGKCAGCVACDDVIDHVLAINQSGATDGQERYTKDVIMNRVEKETRLAAGRELGDPDADSSLRAAATKYSERAREIAEKLAACGGDAPAEEEVEAPPVIVEEVAEKVFSHYTRGKQRPIQRWAEPEKVQRLRVSFTRLGVLRYLSHLDQAKVLAMAMRRAKAPLSYSEGFNAKPKIAFSPPLPLGAGGFCEIMDVTLTEAMDPAELIARLNEIAVDGLKFLSAEVIDLKAESIDASAAASAFLLRLDADALKVSLDEVGGAIAAFMTASEVPAEVKKKSGMKTINLKESVLELGAEATTDEDGAAVMVRMTITHSEGHFVQPQVALGVMLGRTLEIGSGVRVDRERIILAEQGVAV